MSYSGSVFSGTLREITKTKLEEIAMQRTVFQNQLSDLIKSLGVKNDPIKRLSILLYGVETCLGVSGGPPKNERQTRLATELSNVKRFLAQAQYDPSISPRVVKLWGKCISQHLSVQLRKLKYAELYGRLVTEWLKSDKNGLPENADAVQVDNPDMQSSRTKRELRDSWERMVSTPTNVDTEALDQYLTDLFDANREDTAALERVRKNIRDCEATFSNSDPFNIVILRWVIAGLRTSDGYTNEQCEVLNDFLGNDVLLAEISHLLNMRINALERWSWGDAVPVETRRNLNGSYTIYMHEDLLQSMFLHYIGVTWSTFFKDALSIFNEASSTDDIDVLSKDEYARREYCLGYQTGYHSQSLQMERSLMYKKQYFLHRLLDKENQQMEDQEGEELAEEFRGARFCSTMPAPDSERAGIAARKAASEKTSTKNSMEAKQNILHILSAEIIINKQLYGGLTCFHSAFKSWNVLLPHGLILAVLKFFGVSAKWLGFFQKFLQPPLKFVDEDGSLPRLRVRGTPASHALSDVFGEVVLFCIDSAVNRATEGGKLYRVSDDFWFWSKDRKQCEKAWFVIQNFAKGAGLELDPAKTGAARISELDADGDDAYRKDLFAGGFYTLTLPPGDSRSTATAWTRPSKNCENSYRIRQKASLNSYTLGTALPLHSSALISEAIFDGGSVTKYLKDTIRERFDVEDVNDGFLFFPAELGGLGLKSPFVNLLQIRQSVTEDPYEGIRSFVKAERSAYNRAKSQFEQKLLDRDYERGHDEWKPAENADVFFPFEEFVRYREDRPECFTPRLVDVYRELLEKPEEEGIDGSVQVMHALEQLKGVDNLKGIIADWDGMEAYWKWIAQMYGPEIIEKLGGFSLVDPGLLPIGMVNMLQQKRVEWQG